MLRHYLVKCTTFFYLSEGNVAFHYDLLKFSSCHKMLPKLVRIADWYSIHALLQQPNSAVPLPWADVINAVVNKLT